LDEAQVRREAFISGTEQAREVFSQGEVRKIVVDVSRDENPVHDRHNLGDYHN
jgi:hypothetical protein